MSNPKYKYAIIDGCMWEGGPWYIDTDHEVGSFGGGKMCKHCHSERNGKYQNERVWIVPRIVITYNEGGFNNTGLCLDCILDAVAMIERPL